MPDRRRRIRPSPSRPNARLRWASAISQALAVVGIAVLGVSVDTSPLAGLPDAFAIERDVAYGPGAHHRLDLAYDRTLSRPRPALVMIHQGGWFQGDKSSYHPLMTEYVQLGYLTVSINFRPSGEARFPAAVDDCKLALRWLRTNAATYGLDPKRIGVTGWSSGAHLALMVAVTADPPDARVQAVVAHSGVYDFLIERSGRFPNAESDEAVVRFLGVPPRQDPELARRASPFRFLTVDDPPLLVFHGELDRRIDVEQARQLASTSKALGRKDEVILLPAADHGQDVLPVDSESRRLVREFLARHLRPGE